jgi:hypothetical protein
MEQSPYETNIPPGTKKIPRLLYNPNICYRVHNNMPLDSVLGPRIESEVSQPILEDPFNMILSILGLPSDL